MVNNRAGQAMRKSKSLWCSVMLGLALLASACEKERPAYALTSTGRILGFDAAKPAKIKTEVRVTGLSNNESLIQLDYRPATGSFYGMTNMTRLCVVDPVTGVASLVNSTSFTTETLTSPVIDFNPAADRLRVIASQQNLRVNPNDGTATTDTDVFFDSDDVNDDSAPQLAALAYDQNRSGASSTTLFSLDVPTQSLVRVGSKNGTPDSPNTGRLFTVAKLSVPFTLNSGFDIEPDGDAAYAALSASGTGAVLYRIDLRSGVADRVDEIGDGDVTIISLTVGPEKNAGSDN